MALLPAPLGDERGVAALWNAQADLGEDVTMRLVAVFETNAEYTISEFNGAAFWRLAYP